MATLKIKRIDSNFVEKNYPELFLAVNKIEGLTDIQKQKVYGLSIDIVEKSGGLISVFDEEYIQTSIFNENIE